MYKVNFDYSTEYPAVLTTAWTAEDGTKAQFLANYLAKNVTCRIDLSGTNGADLLDSDGGILERLIADNIELTVPANRVVMLAIK